MTEQTLIPCKGRKRLCKSSLSSLQSRKNSSDDDDNLFDSDNGDCRKARNKTVENPTVSAIPSNGMKRLTQNEELLLSHKNSRDDDDLFNSEKEDRIKPNNKRVDVKIEAAVTSVPYKGRKRLSQTEPLLLHKNNSDDDNLFDSDKEDATSAIDKRVDAKGVIISAVPSNGRKRLCKRESSSHSSSDDDIFDSDAEDIVTKNKKEKELVQNDLTSTLHNITHGDITKANEYDQNNEKNENEKNVNDLNDNKRSRNNPDLISNEQQISDYYAVSTSEYDPFLTSIIINDDIHQLLYILINCSTYIENKTSSTLNDDNTKTFKKNFDINNSITNTILSEELFISIPNSSSQIDLYSLLLLSISSNAEHCTRLLLTINIRNDSDSAKWNGGFLNYVLIAAEKLGM
jgi:hypothetical protein